MDVNEARKIQMHRVCSDCYCAVIAVRNRKTGEFEIQCSTPGCQCRGTISTRTLERRQAENAAEAQEAKRTLQAAAPWVNPQHGKSEDQLLKELGF